MLFALGASRAMGAATAAHLGVALSALEERAFEDGEHKTRSLENVRGRDVYVLHSLHADAHESPNDKLVKLLFFIGSLRDAGAGRVSAVVPYLAYARKDQRSKSRDPVATRYVAGFFESVGCDAILTVDVHNLAAFENAFRCRAQNLGAAAVLAERVASLVGAAPVVVVSPDAGGIKRADRFRALLAQRLARPVGAAFAEKYRSAGQVRGGSLVGEVRDSVAVIVDDLVAAGTTLELAAGACRAAGASSVIAAATHGVFAPRADATLGASEIRRIVVTDTIPSMRLTDPGLVSRVERVSIAPLLADAIALSHAGGDLEALTPG